MEKNILKVDPVAYKIDEPVIEFASDNFIQEDDYEWDEDDLEGEGFAANEFEEELELNIDFDEEIDDDFDDDFDDEDGDDDF